MSAYSDGSVWDTCGCDHDADKHDVVPDEDERGRYEWLWCRVCPGGCADAGTKPEASHDGAR